MKDLLALLAFDSVFSWLAIVATLIAIILIPKIFGVSWINGLLFAQATLFFTSLTTIAGLSTGGISERLGIHYFCIEFVFYIAMYAIYGSILKKSANILRALSQFYDGNTAYFLIFLSIVLAVFNYVNQADEGTSRIAYMASSWFSFVKPFIQVFAPASSLGVLILFLRPKKRILAYILLSISILANVLTGSKASFATSLLTSFLVLRDLAGNNKLGFRQTDIKLVICLTLVSVFFVLARLDVTLSDLFDRFLLSGEANLLTYFSDDPTAACENVTMFAKMHRGWARLAGDPTANDIDTLFGYALMIKAVGINAFTGPNARLSAYALCNFPGTNLLFLSIVVSAYFFLVASVFRKFLAHPIIISLVYPYLVSSLSSSAQDFNLIMQDISYLLVFQFIGLFLLTRKAQFHG